MISSPHLLLSLILAAGTSLAQIKYDGHYAEAVNFTQLFSKEIIFADVWHMENWNGLTTYAAAKPLRCFGSDASTKYDVAVLGMVAYPFSDCVLTYSLLGAPFDTATSYRPGYV